jgi:hypothetical protein
MMGSLLRPQTAHSMPWVKDRPSASHVYAGGNVGVSNGQERKESHALDLERAAIILRPGDSG